MSTTSKITTPLPTHHTQGEDKTVVVLAVEV